MLPDIGNNAIDVVVIVASTGQMLLDVGVEIYPSSSQAMVIFLCRVIAAVCSCICRLSAVLGLFLAPLQRDGCHLTPPEVLNDALSSR